jgi:hypothetical protein
MQELWQRLSLAGRYLGLGAKLAAQTTAALLRARLGHDGCASAIAEGHPEELLHCRTAPAAARMTADEQALAASLSAVPTDRVPAAQFEQTL